MFDNNVSTFSLSLRSAHSIKNKDIKLSERLRVPSNNLKFELGKVGPKDGDDFIGETIWQHLIFFNTSSNSKEFSKYDFLIFIDAVNLWGVDYDSSLDSNEIRSAIGLGLDWYSPVGPMNFSIAQPISKAQTYYRNF